MERKVQKNNSVSCSKKDGKTDGSRVPKRRSTPVLPQRSNPTHLAMDLQGALSLVKAYPHYPKHGILFQDIHPVMYNAEARKVVQDHLAARYKGMLCTALVCFLFDGLHVTSQSL